MMRGNENIQEVDATSFKNNTQLAIPLFQNDHSLIEKIKTQWQFGDWNTLVSNDRELLWNQGQNGLIALFIAAGYFQIGNTKRAAELINYSIKCGINKRALLEVLVSGVYNCLGRALTICKKDAHAQKLFFNALKVVSIEGDKNLLCDARINTQINQLKSDGFEVLACNLFVRVGSDENLLRASDPNAILEKDISSKEPLSPLKVEQSAKFDLGMGWSGNTINTAIFRHHGILTWEGFQYTAFYVDISTLRVVQRNLNNDCILINDIRGGYNLRDAHNGINLGIDVSGYVHLSYDHHATKLRYRRSTNPHSIGSWTEELPMTGMHEERVTYPTFILPRMGYPLTLIYRDGVHNRGTARIKTYDEQAQEWKDHSFPILSGSEHKPWTSNAYWNHPAVGSDGSLHLSFCWRTDVLGRNQLVSNINLGYAWSPDNGLSWFNAHGKPYKLPITQVNSEAIWPISSGSNLINQTGMALDSNNRPHIVFYANDNDSIPQYQHIWFDGRKWNHQNFSNRIDVFNLQGGGTLSLPISRPEVFIDASDRVYALFRGDLTSDCMSISLLLDNGANQDQLNIKNNVTTIWSENLGFSEPIMDRTRWNAEKVLTMLIQKNQQPNGDKSSFDLQNHVSLVDFVVNTQIKN